MTSIIIIVEPLQRDGDLTVLTMAAILNFFKLHNFNCRYGQYMRQLVKFRADRSNRCGHMVVFRFFQDRGRPPSWICFTPIWTTHEEHSVVFVIAQNLAKICAVVLITCML